MKWICHRAPDWRAWGRLAVGCLIAAAGPRAWALDPAEKPANYIASRWDAEEGLPHNSVTQIFQTRDGYLWIGTLQGLARFDGLTFTIFTSHNTPGLLNSQITSFAETADGSLWIGTSFGLTRYQHGRFTSYGEADGVKGKTGTVNAVCVAPDGSLWIGSQDGITRWVEGRFVNDIDTSAYDVRGMRALFVDRQKAMWLAIGSEALRYQDGKFTRFGPEQGLPAQRVEKIREAADGRICAMTQNGLLWLKEERFVPFEHNGALSSPRVGTALADHAGNLWIGSVGGLDRYSAGKVTPYVDRTGNKLGVVDALFEDREGCLWIGTSAGLYRLTDPRAHTLPMRDGGGGALALAVTQTRDEAVWISSWADGVHRIQDDGFTHYAFGAPLSHETVTAIYESPDGVMWFGNRGSSLDRLEGSNVTTFVYQSGVASSRPVTAILADEDGTLLLGISKRGLLQLRDGQIGPVPEAAEFAPETVWTLHRPRNGRLLMGTSKGLYERRADRTWHRVDLGGGLPPVIVRALLEAADDTIWLATDGHGLIRWQKGAARAYDVRVGMVDNLLFSVLDDHLGSLWVSSGRGIAKIRKSEFDEMDRGGITRLNCLTFGRADGLLSASSLGAGSPAAVRLADGRLMTATDQGVAVIAPQRLQVNRQPPTVVIESVMADEQPLPPGPGVTIPAGVNRLEIRYTALSLIAPQRLRFRYQLEGADPRWVEAGHARVAHYTRLAPGRYTFRVLACNNDGVWNEIGATLALTMLPQLHQTLWFRLTAITLVVTALASLVWLRLRQINQRQETLKRMNTELDQRVVERTAELAKANEALQTENTERQRAEAALTEASNLLESLLENSPDFIYFKDRESRFLRYSKGFMRHFGLVHSESLKSKTDFDIFDEAHARPAYEDEQTIIRTGQPILGKSEKEVWRDGHVTWALTSKMPLRDAQGRIIGTFGISKDITAIKDAESKLEQVHKQLMETSRQAGMAEIATNVLHNVGNVLNSVNISATLVLDNAQKSRIYNLAKVVALFQEHAHDLGAFMTQDSKGKQVPVYLARLSEQLLADQTAMVGELDSLRRNVEHIKEIVAMQQSYATFGGVKEMINVVNLVEDSLRMHEGALSRHRVAVVREFEKVPPLNVEKHKLLQILVNLLRNAKHACQDSDRADKRLTVRVARGAGQVRISVRDNGVGIPRENLTRIFSHGFTTRKDGHGFGLHSSALAAKEMGGSLTVHSAGPGQGATFTLELPCTGGPT